MTDQAKPPGGAAGRIGVPKRPALERSTPSPTAHRKYQNSPSLLEGRTVADVEAELDHTLVAEGDWIKSPLADGSRNRYYNGKGGSIQVNRGYPQGLKNGGGDSAHAGPYVKIQPNQIRRPLATDANPEG